MVHWHFVFWTERTPQSLKWSPISLSILIHQECSPFLLPLTSWDFPAFLQGYFTHDWFIWLYVHFASWAWEPIVYVHPENSWECPFLVHFLCMRVISCLTHCLLFRPQGKKQTKKEKEKEKVLLLVSCICFVRNLLLTQLFIWQSPWITFLGACEGDIEPWNFSWCKALGLLYNICVFCLLI